MECGSWDKKNRCIRPEFLDESQYVEVIKHYLLDIDYNISDIASLLEKQEVQNEVQWLFDLVLNENKSEFFYDKVYRLMSPETRQRNQQYLEKIITLSLKNNNKYEIENNYEFLNKEQFERFLPQFLNMYTDENGKVNLEHVVGILWGRLNEENQIEYFDYFKNYILEHAGRENNSEVYFKNYYYMMFQKSKEATRNYYVDSIIEATKDEKGIVNLEIIENMFKLSTENIKISDESFSEIFKAYSLAREKKDYINSARLARIWDYIEKDVQKKNLLLLFKQINSYDFEKIWDSTNISVKKDLYDELIKEMELNSSSDIVKKYKGLKYIQMLNEMGEEERSDELNKNMPKFLKALVTKNIIYDKENDEKREEVKQEDLEKYAEKYNLQYAKILIDLDNKNGLSPKNIYTVIKELPTLGENIIYRVINSNSKFIQQQSNEIVSKLAEKPEKAQQMLTELEDVFAKDKLPDFIKLYKYFEVLNYEKKLDFLNLDWLSPAILNTESKKLSKRIIFSDLMRIGMDSNNKSLKKFVNTLENGNNLFENIKNGKEIKDFSDEDKSKAQDYVETLYALYEQSGAYSNDKKNGAHIVLTGDLMQDYYAIEKRFAHKGHTAKLPDIMLQTIIGPYQELFEGIDSIKKIKDYMKAKIEESNKKHFELAKEKMNIQQGDLIKGVRDGVQVFHSIVSNGVRAGEFLGTNHHSDCTPLDTDFSAILDDNTENTFLDKLKWTVSGSGYGTMFLVVKYDKNKMEYSRVNDDLTVQNNGGILADKIKTRDMQETTRKRVNDRASGKYDTKKLEIFSSSPNRGGSHYGIRTGLGITDVDYIVLRQKYDKRLGYELAMNGTYIPIYDAETEELVFSPEDYNKIREQMQGIPYYETGDFKVSESAKTEQAKKIVEELFSNGDVEKSKSAEEARVKRTAIQYQVTKALYEKMGLGVEPHLTGNMQDGFVEFVDTGSTGRGTNVPGTGDFDFIMRVDKNIFDNNMGQLQENLRKVLAIKSDDEESKTEEFGGNFRYKKVKIEGLDEPVDIDITFIPKDKEITYSTDMCVKERLNALKETDPEGYKYTIANIILAKRLLKEQGLYKKSNSNGATEYGGFGGVGVENWILQNGGSLSTAIESFLEAADESKDYEEFQEKYPIFDFGENHSPKASYPHDSFIRGLTDVGYDKMKEYFKELQQELVPVKKENSNNKLAETIMQDVEIMAQSARVGTINDTMHDIQDAVDEVKKDKKEAKTLE